MKKIIVAGLVAGIVLLVLSLLGLYATIWVFPRIALEYFDSSFETQADRVMVYYIHPFVISIALSWFWSRFKSVLTGGFIMRGIEFGLIYAVVAILPMMWLIYSAMNVSLVMVSTWFILGLAQGIISGLIFEKINP